MSDTRITLQSRIATLMIISSILLISAFTFTQINNQISDIQRFNVYKASLNAEIIDNNLEAVIREYSVADIPLRLGQNLKDLKDSGAIEKAIVYDSDGKVIASTEEDLAGQNATFRDQAKLQELRSISSGKKSFLPSIDKAKNAINIYVGLNLDPEQPPVFAAKLTSSLGNLQEAIIAIYKQVILSILLIVLANIILGYFLSKKIVGPVKVLNDVTKIIAGGDLTVRTRIETNDELQELGETFNYMTEELIKMKERAENANPLTKLPGNIVIHEQIESRINANKKFTVIYCDLDNFKAFNDKYGIAKGDEAIKLTAEVFKEAVGNKGGTDDFIGHEGGDDFILITTPDKAQAVADYITSEFDKRVRSLYSSEDLAAGFIIAHGRDKEEKKFPIMSISLAGISNETRKISSYGEVTNIAAEVKKKAKAIGGSNFVLDKRTG